MQLPAKVIFFRGPDLIIETANEALLNLWNKTRAEAVGRPLLEVLPELKDQPFPDELRHVYETGNTITRKEVMATLNLPGGGTNSFYNDYFYQPLTDSKGRRIGVLATSIAQIELLLTYTDRFYHRQFIARKINNHQVLDRLEQVLSEYFNSDDIGKHGLPAVAYIAEKLNISPNYLSGLLKVLTGQSTQQHIHYKLIEKAKEKLSTTALSVSEIAYSLGFEHPQSFSKLFKTKTKLSPVEFRQAFN